MAGEVRAGVIGDLLESWHGFQHAISTQWSFDLFVLRAYLGSDLVTLAIAYFVEPAVYLCMYPRAYKVGDPASSAELRPEFRVGTLYSRRRRGRGRRSLPVAKLGRQITRLPFMQLVRATNVGHARR